MLVYKYSGTMVRIWVFQVFGFQRCQMVDLKALLNVEEVWTIGRGSPKYWIGSAFCRMLPHQLWAMWFLKINLFLKPTSEKQRRLHFCCLNPPKTKDVFLKKHMFATWTSHGCYYCSLDWIWAMREGKKKVPVSCHESKLMIFHISWSTCWAGAQSRAIDVARYKYFLDSALRNKSLE